MVQFWQRDACHRDEASPPKVISGVVLFAFAGSLLLLSAVVRHAYTVYPAYAGNI